jgi:ATP-dependent protease ClpP protease subunit
METIGPLMQQALTLDRALPPDSELYMVMATPGGSIQAGLELITFLNSLKHPIHTITIFSASMGFHIVQQMRGERYILPFGTLMTHRAYGSFEGEFPGQLDSRYKFYLRRLRAMDRLVVKRLGNSYTMKSYNTLYADEFWVDGSDAVRIGFADATVKVRCGDTLSGTREEKLNFLGFQLKITWSQCPLILTPLKIEEDVPLPMTPDTEERIHSEINKLMAPLKTPFSSRPIEKEPILR